MTLPPVGVAACEGSRNRFAQGQTVEGDLSGQGVCRVVVLMSTFHIEYVQQIASGPISDEGNETPVAGHTARGIGRGGLCVHEPEPGHIGKAEQAATGVVLRRIGLLSSLVNDNELMGGRLLGPSGLGVSGPVSVAQVVGQLVARTEVVDVEIIEVAVVQDRAVA